MRTIKKYSNRRLYDTTDSRYLNLEELAGLVQRGETVTVVDAKSGADLTRSVLLQVLMEAQGGMDLFPVGMLHRIIRFAVDSPMHGAIRQQTAAGMALLDAQLGRLEAQFGTAGTGWPPPPAAPASQAAGSSAAEAPSATADPGGPGAPTADAGGGPKPELDALRARLAALEARLRK